MSFEASATAVITRLTDCLTASVYVYAVLHLIASCLMIMSITARYVPPVDWGAVLFHMWFGCVTLAIVLATRPLLSALFFPDALKATVNELPLASCTLTSDGKEYSVRYIQFKENEDSKTTVAFLCDRFFPCHKTNDANGADAQPVASPPPADECSAAANDSASSPPESPTERSQADTETDAQKVKVDEITAC
jgi:hypothetical protein